MRAAVLGHPIAHSLSPALHQAAYRELGLANWRYDAFDVDQAGLAGFLAGLDGAEWAGLSLTRPLKQVVLGLLDHIEPLAQAVGAVNTVLLTPAGWVGANTDVYGMVQALTDAGPLGQADSAALLGGGATAASALAAVAELGLTTVEVFVRSTARCQALMSAAGRMGLSPRFRAWPSPAAAAGSTARHDWAASVVISTLPTGAAAPLAGQLAGADLTGRVLLDVAYDPWPSALAQAWQDGGGRLATGLDMLLHQAAEQFRLMTGRLAPLAAMRAALPTTSAAQ
ncbi:MAG: shikimate dehydrogenase [Micrococcales bacterium]|nr:shikimate dehydrogenase [Micrococcales bacterium]